MGEGRIMLTREGYNSMQKDLVALKGPKRRQIAEDLAEARAQGDLSENAEYDAAKEAQAMNEKRIAEIENILSRAQLIDESAISKDEALLGATVRVKDLDANEEFDYMLVSEEESDFDLNKISITSPVGKALLGHRVGDEVQANVPAGDIRYEIVSISR